MLFAISIDWSILDMGSVTDSVLAFQLVKLIELLQLSTYGGVYGESQCACWDWFPNVR